jgi:hypothetical protein
MDGPRFSSDVIIHKFKGVENIVKDLDSDEKYGIDLKTLDRRRKCHGSNIYPPQQEEEKSGY